MINPPAEYAIQPRNDSETPKNNRQKNSQSAIQSAKELPSKCKNCTLEERAVLRIIQQNPTATQKQIAAQIGKSERTIKTITVNLSQQEIIVRRSGKRNGYWQILND